MSVRTSTNTLVLGLIAVNLAGCLPIPLLPGDTSGTRLNIGERFPTRSWWASRREPTCCLPLESLTVRRSTVNGSRTRAFQVREE